MDYDPDRLQSEYPSGGETVRVRPKKTQYTREEARAYVREVNPDITNGAVEGEVDNLGRESGFRSVNPGDYDKKTGRYTSDGGYQHHNERLANGKAWASKHNLDWEDLKTQIMFGRWEKEHDYPGLLKFQQSNDDRGANEEAFKRIFEKPASVLWQNNASGEPVLDSPRFKFSNYALNQFENDPGTDVRMMSPMEYLQLSPKLEGKPFESPSGRSLMQSVNKGEPIEQIPSLDVKMDGGSAQVTDQDGRHRALLAQQEGVQAIPVAVKGLGGAQPKEIVGMDGIPQAFDHPRRQPQQQPQGGLLQQIGNAIVPSAEAAEVPAWAKDQPAQPQQSQVPVWAQEPPQETPQKPVAQMSQEEARAANLSPEQQREWMNAQQARFGQGPVEQLLSPDNAAAATRGVAPIAAGAGIGAGIGALAGGVGAIPGAAIGAGAAGLTEAVTGLLKLGGVPTYSPSQVTNALLDLVGVRKSETPEQRLIEAMAGGAASSAGVATALGRLGATLKNPASRATAAAIESRTSKAVNALAANPELQTLSGALSGFASQEAAELGASPAVQFLAGVAGGMTPPGKGMTPNFWRLKNPSAAARQAIENGFVIAPVDAEAGHIGSMSPTNSLAGMAGKVKDQQMASALNQPVVNAKVQQELRVPDGTPLYKETLKGVRDREGAVYREVEQAIPEIDLKRDPVLVDAVQKMGQRSESTETNFPSTKQPPEVQAMRNEILAKDRQPTGDVLKYIADLRSRAIANFQAHGEGAAMAHRKGFAEREAANALEDAVERSVQNAPQYYREKLADAVNNRDNTLRERAIQGLPLYGDVVDNAQRQVQNWSDRLATSNAKNQGNQTLLDRLKNARKTIAQTYDVESVINPASGDVSASGLRILQEHSKPLTGNLKEIADAAGNFRKSFQNPAAFGGVEPLSVLDAGFAVHQGAKAIAKGLAGDPGAFAHFMAMLSPLLRHVSRERLFQPSRQRAMVADPVGRNFPSSLVTAPLLPREPVPGNPSENALLGLGQTPP